MLFFPKTKVLMIIDTSGACFAYIYMKAACSFILINFMLNSHWHTNLSYLHLHGRCNGHILPNLVAFRRYLMETTQTYIPTRIEVIEARRHLEAKKN